MNEAMKQKGLRALAVAGLTLTCLCVLPARGASLGDFEAATDVGKIDRQGSSEFLPDQSQYRIAGSGANIWGKEDAFQYLWKKVSGDLHGTDFAVEIHFHDDELSARNLARDLLLHIQKEGKRV